MKNAGNSLIALAILILVKVLIEGFFPTDNLIFRERTPNVQALLDFMYYFDVIFKILFIGLIFYAGLSLRKTTN